MNNRSGGGSLSRRETVRAGLGAIVAIVGMGAARKAVVAQVPTVDSGGDFSRSVESKRARNFQPPVDLENDDYEVYLASWGEYQIWPVSSPPSDAGLVSTGFRGTWYECDAYIRSLPEPKPIFDF